VDEESVVSGMLDDDLPPEDVSVPTAMKNPLASAASTKCLTAVHLTGVRTTATQTCSRTASHTPTNTPTKKIRNDTYTGGSGSPGIRKVESMSAGHSNFWSSSSKKDVGEQEKDRIKAEARRLQEKGRAAAASGGSSRRDFSYTIGDDAATTISGSTADEERRERRRVGVRRFRAVMWRVVLVVRLEVMLVGPRPIIIRFRG